MGRGSLLQRSGIFVTLLAFVFGASADQWGAVNAAVLGPRSADGERPSASALPPSLTLAPPPRLSLERAISADLDQELHCLALNVYWEARSEPWLGQLAVAKVTLNRVAHGGFPDTICGVVRQGERSRSRSCQFSWACDGRKDRPRNDEAWRRAQDIAYRALFQGTPDPTRGALWFHATYVKPSWARVKKRTTQIGRHIYYVR